MRPAHLLVALGGAALIAGCAASIPPKAAYDSIGRELDQAAASKPAAQPAKDMTQALLPPLITDQGETARKAVEPRFDLSVSGAPATQVFLAIVSGTRYSLALHPNVSGEVSVSLKNVNVLEALDTLRDLYGYDYKLEGSRITVLPNTLRTHVFQVNYLAAKRQGMSDVRVTSGSIIGSTNQPIPAGTLTPGAGSRSQESSQLTTRVDNDFWEELRATLAAIVGSEGGRSVVVNPMSGVVVVRGLPVDVRNAENYLRATQLIAERQVMLEAKIIEVQLRDSTQSGINWAHIGNLAGRPLGISSNLGGATFPTSGSPFLSNNNAISNNFNLAGNNTILGLAFQTDNFAALLQMLETQGDVQVLSSPRIATLNNQQAVLKVGTDEFFVTNVTATSTTGGSGTTTFPTVTLQPFFSGIALDVTPQIDNEDNIILHVHPSISVVSEKKKVIDLGGTELGEITLPLAASSVNETDSIVRVKDNYIVAIGGLFTQEQRADQSGLLGTTGVPILRDLFGQRARKQSKREIVILIKPTIIKGASNWQEGLDEVRGRLTGFPPPLPQPTGAGQ